MSPKKNSADSVPYEMIFNSNKPQNNGLKRENNTTEMEIKYIYRDVVTVGKERAIYNNHK